MFTAACIGKDGREWVIHLPVDIWEDAENIIEQLGLTVAPNGIGKLVMEVDQDEFRLSSMREQ